MSDQISQIAGDDDLSIEELEQVAGGVVPIDDAEKPNTNCGTNCHCGG